MGASGTESDRVLVITAGQPVAQKITVRDAINVWPTLPELEVRAQLRQGKSTNTTLIENLHDYMVSAFDGNDLVIDWVMTGAETRELYDKEWGYLKTGYFDVVISDIGTIDSRALTVPPICLKINPTTTTAAGDA